MIEWINEIHNAHCGIHERRWIRYMWPISLNPFYLLFAQRNAVEKYQCKLKVISLTWKNWDVRIYCSNKGQTAPEEKNCSLVQSGTPPDRSVLAAEKDYKVDMGYETPMFRELLLQLLLEHILKLWFIIWS